MSGLRNFFGGGGGSQTPTIIETPTTPEPTVIPMANSDAARKTKKKSYAAQRKRTGRRSTILSTEDKLG